LARAAHRYRGDGKSDRIRSAITRILEPIGNRGDVVTDDRAIAKRGCEQQDRSSDAQAGRDTRQSRGPTAGAATRKERENAASAVVLLSGFDARGIRAVNRRATPLCR